jgi:hypothetical protein
MRRTKRVNSDKDAGRRMPTEMVWSVTVGVVLTLLILVGLQTGLYRSQAGLVCLLVITGLGVVVVPLIAFWPNMVAARAWCRAYRRGQRVRRGLCAGCGYDLRGTPERCPECGMVSAAGQERGA